MDTVLLDLDGTLADTAPDMAAALNRLLDERGREQLAFETVRAQVSHGSIGLLRLGFDSGPGDEEFEALRQRFLDLYQSALCVHTRLFPGMPEVLRELDRRGQPWGVVTNKPGWLTDPLLEQLALPVAPCCVVSGDTLARRKPWPDPLLHACASAGREPYNCVYIGDAQRDMQAGQRAGMPTLTALFGYIGPDDHPEEWGADGMLETPTDLWKWLS
ncbi:MAG: HAD-IA family hydrolase [Gammaproteobacteria bacterium]|nr:HAD-IA family hydrolase [Gammaproteobacteria bacterium]